MSQALQRADAELYVEVQQFYAQQLPLLEARRFSEFVATFTEAGSLEHTPNGGTLVGRNQILAEMQARHEREKDTPHYNERVYRHWFDRMSIEPLASGELRVTYQSLVTVTDWEGDVSFEPTTTVVDVLARVGGELYTKSRVVTHDSANWAAKA